MIKLRNYYDLVNDGVIDFEDSLPPSQTRRKYTEGGTVTVYKISKMTEEERSHYGLPTPTNERTN
ncbi:hypothetical protein ACH0B5_07235 [Ureibacillus sp. 179-F W5.1 NHS]|uniref:hypothetical protein n=1 Tax=Ureibacillus sp. 179-F W5.1 NHS TaxID=3374297 RepID=UPI003879952F